MRTIVYIDGYNLFYGCLTNTPYKWLDLASLFEKILRAQSPSDKLLAVKYFTAGIKASLASQGQAATQAQTQYHRALKACGNVEIISGYYILEGTTAPKREDGKPPDKAVRTPIWRLDEKQTDVNIALHMYRDAATEQCDQIVLCSNDTDLVPAFKMIGEDFPRVRLAVVIPTRKGSGRPPSGGLSEHASWTRRYLLESELAENQFPDRVPTRKKPALKPSYW